MSTPPPCPECGGPAEEIGPVILTKRHNDESIVRVGCIAYACQICVRWNDVLNVEYPFKFCVTDPELTKQLLPESLRAYE